VSRIIEVVVSPTGEATVQTRGYAGGECFQASRFLEQALGVATGERKRLFGKISLKNLIRHYV
jgi:hypothetical protein